MLTRRAFGTNTATPSAIARVARRALRPAITRDRAIDTRRRDRPAQRGARDGIATATACSAASADHARDRKQTPMRTAQLPGRGARRTGPDRAFLAFFGMIFRNFAGDT